MGTRKVFTKIDLRWGYNNIQIKEGNEWKAVFTIHLGVYEPTVIFFGLTNLPAIFQAMMNNILQDLIDTGDVVAFMNDILVGTEDKRKHDEVVEEILKRMELNDLYLKSEKYV